MIKSICIVRLSALGDVLMLVPLVRTLQAAYPEAAITWVISRPAYFLVEGMDGVEFVVIDKPNSLADYWRFRQQFKNRQFDVLLATQASFRANLLYPLIRAKRKIGYDSLRAKDGHWLFVKETISPGNDHTLDGFLRFADSLGIMQHQLRWDMPIGVAERTFARSQLPESGPIMLVNPAASKAERSWPIERYIEVIKAAKQRWNVKVVLTGGPGDDDRRMADAILAQVDCVDLVGKTKPKQLLAIIEHADVLLCPDTGPSHMAVSVGTPVVALHAVTSTEVSGPYTYRHLAVDKYDEAVVKILKKTKQTNIWGTHAHGPDTMKLVPVDEVMEKLSQVLGAKQ